MPRIYALPPARKFWNNLKSAFRANPLQVNHLHKQIKVRLPIFSGNLAFINHCKYLYARHLQKIRKCRLFRLKTLERLFLLRHTVLADDLTAICHAHCIVDVEGVHKGLLEPVIVLVLRLAPLNLAEC